MQACWELVTKPLAAAAVLAITASSLPAQTPCGGPSGPDVIVGALTGPSNFTSTGGGTLEALSLGTTSCNQGQSALSWRSNNNQHPVIGGELYRFKFVNGAGRFEQVGLSWLKHGFFAESQTLCCPGCQATDGTKLGPGCSDPYTSDRNATQSLLGPRYQVNAFTGAFTYPPPHPSGGNTGRLEVAVADCEASSPSGTRYFANAQYITPDDAAAGNGTNNASYREVTCFGAGTAWSFSFPGSTQREVPAIRAWAVCESGVTLQNVQIPSEGMLILGHKVTDLGGGQYHYEYALYNMNSDRCIGSFGIPIPANVVVTNVGFHDVTYRGGDGVGGVNFSGADWPTKTSGGLFSWDTTAFSSDPNANALRFGTTYNFRFDANSPPTAGTITLGTFKVPGAVQVSAEIPSGDASPGVPFCFGDGTANTCPCGNAGDPGSGCANSQNPGGARLASSGTQSPDTVVLTASGELPSVLSIVLQGTTNNPSGFLFGDGLRCATGTLKRLYVKNAVGGVVTAPAGGDLSITAQSAAKGDTIPSGGTRTYQVYYRDSSASFCPAPPGDGFNVTNAVRITW